MQTATRRNRARMRRALSSGALVLAAHNAAHAQVTYFWRNEAGSGNWNVTNNWFAGSPVNANQIPAGNEVLEINNNNQTSMTNDLGNVSRYRLNLESNATNARTINGTTTNNFFDFGGNAPQINNRSSATHVINFPIAIGNSNLNQQLELNAVNGNFTFGSTFRAHNGATRRLIGNPSTDRTITLNGVISDGSEINASNKIEFIKNGGGTVTMGTINTYTGTTTINAGTVAISGDSGLGTAPSSPADSLFIASNAALRALASFTLNANRRVVLGSNTANTNGWISPSTGNVLNIAGELKNGAGNNGLVKFGGGELLLSGLSTYSNDTFITVGTLSIGQGASIASPFVRVGETSGVENAAFTISDADGGTTVSNGIVVRDGSVGIKRLASTATQGTNTFSGNVFVEAAVTSVSAGGGTLQFSGTTMDLKNNAWIVSGAGNTVVDNGFKNPTVSETGLLTKSDSGTLYLDGVSTYRGTTTINGGTVFANHTHTGGGLYTVNTGATLAGSGSLPSGVLVNDGGKLAPGESIGTMTIGGSLTLNPTSVLEVEFDVDGPLFDADLVIAGTGVNVGGGELRFSFTSAAIQNFTPGKTFIIVRNDSGLATTGPFLAVPTESDQLQYDIVYNFSGPDDRGQTGNGNDVAVTFTSVPEPASMAILGFAALMARRRRV